MYINYILYTQAPVGWAMNRPNVFTACRKRRLKGWHMGSIDALVTSKSFYPRCYALIRTGVPEINFCCSNFETDMRYGWTLHNARRGIDFESRITKC